MFAPGMEGKQMRGLFSSKTLTFDVTMQDSSIMDKLETDGHLSSNWDDVVFFKGHWLRRGATGRRPHQSPNAATGYILGNEP